ncbi:MAG TPA: M20 family metallopeptidase [Planctomycetota bacterium]|nr:M20 family metallopeptidase [Planctomycetota bacterium]
MTTSNPKEHPARVVRLLADLIAIPSVNVDPETSDRCNPEAGMVDYLERYLTRLGGKAERREVRSGRQNLLVRFPGRDRSKTLALEAHIDTVGVAGMTIPPHTPQIINNRITGRGSCDTKGSLAAFVEAIERVVESKQLPPWDLLLIAMMGEETGCEGAIALANSGFKADACLIGEATFCKPMIAHKGSVWFRISTAGQTAHGSTPHLGVNAIYRMRHVLSALETVVPAKLSATKDPLLGSPTLSCGIITGGEKPNVVPAQCTVQLDGRILPGADPQKFVNDIMLWVSAAAGDAAGPLTAHGMVFSLPFQIAREHPFTETVLKASRKVLGDSAQPIGGAFFSDAGPLAAAGTPCIVFGPGDIGKAHTPDEYLDVDELVKCAEVTEGIIRTVGS